MAVTRITYQYLEGNLTDGMLEDVTTEQESAIAAAYGVAVEAALQAAFPGAVIEIKSQPHTSGSISWPIIVETTPDNHREMEHAEFEVQRIAEDVWSNSESWWPEEA